MLVRIAGIVQESIVDGPGFRLAVFFQGCPHHCEGCHNPETHSVFEGKLINIGEIIAMMDNPLLDGVTLTGGEPFWQMAAGKKIAKAAHKRGLNVWVYSGWTFERLLQLVGSETFEDIDVLVDGSYKKELRTLDLPWRGSSNQRIIDVKRSIAEGRTIEWEK